MNRELTKQTSNEAMKTSDRAAVRPRVDVYESESEYLVVADMPGVSMDAVDVAFDNGELRVEARRDWKAPGPTLAEEYRPADFQRAFAMPDGIDCEKIAAELARGVLTIHLPKSASRRARKIEVRSN